MFKNFLILLERIAVALETIAKIEYTPKSLDNEVSLIEPPDKEIEDEEFVELKDSAKDLLESNPTNQLWAEAALSDEQLESLE